MSDKDILKDLFSEKLGNYETNVNPQLWNAISSKLATTAVTSSTVGLTLFTKLLIGGSISAAALVGGYFVFSDSSQTLIKKENTSQLSSNSENKKEENDSNTETKSIYSIPTVKESNNSFSKDSENEISIENKEVLSNDDVSNRFIEPIPIQLTQEIIKNEVPKTIGPNEVISEEKLKDPVVESTINEQEEATISTEEVVLYENIFTPNGDGVNDLFFIKTKGLTDFSIVIMNAKNTVVFKSNDPDFVWDGIGMNGEPVEEGKYLYYLTAFDKNGKPVNKYKVLTIEK